MNNKEERKWHEINVEGKILGRISVEIAGLLMGKSKPGFTRARDMGDYVIVTNAFKVKVTGNKESGKIYYHHTGFPQGLRKKSLGDMRKENPCKIIVKAVSGMIPQNKLKAKMLKRLYVYADDNHPYKDKISK